ncbi:MAG: nagZ 2 [Gammaproteobacteria bacterium]|nr:nagZ 2 [Gammaproteobacteria bacterium]
MTVALKEKIGQMLIIGFNGMELNPEDPVVQAILAKRIGGVILFDYNFQTRTYDRNIRNPQQLQHLTRQLQEYARQAEMPLPLFISVDYEGGKVNRLKEAYGFPKTLSAADIAKCDDEQATKYVEEMAATLKENGININFAPVVDVNVNPDNPVIGKLGRSFSEDHQKVSHYARMFSDTYQKQGILSAYKHFPGHGSSTGDTHEGFVDVTDTWKEYELEPYRQLLQELHQGVMVMAAHVVHRGLDEKGYPASLSAAMMTDLLRNKLHFDGVIVTDDLQMKAITDHYGLEEAVQLAINAGADILVFGNQLVALPQDPQEIIDIIEQAVITGKIAESRIDEAYQRIMELKNAWISVQNGLESESSAEAKKCVV